MSTASANCDHCQQPLTALARQRNLTRCDAAACRAADSHRELRQRWGSVADAALQRAAQSLPTAPAPRLLLWLQDTDRALVPVNEADRLFLASRWRQAWVSDSDHALDVGEAAEDLPPQAAALCGHCAGRCCVHGGSQAAFVGAATLRRWLGRHPCATIDDAIAHYLASLPAEHVQGHCCFQGATGCAQPREQRSYVCNEYRCDALSQLGSAMANHADIVAVVLTRADRKLTGAAVFQHGVATALPGVPGPDDLMQ